MGTHAVERVGLLRPDQRAREGRDGGVAAEDGGRDVLLDRRVRTLQSLGGGGAREPGGGLGRERSGLCVSVQRSGDAIVNQAHVIR